MRRTAGGIAQRDHARGRCRKLRRLMRCRTSLVRLAPAAPADCGANQRAFLKNEHWWASFRLCFGHNSPPRITRGAAAPQNIPKSLVSGDADRQQPASNHSTTNMRVKSLKIHLLLIQLIYKLYKAYLFVCWLLICWSAFKSSGRSSSIRFLRLQSEFGLHCAKQLNCSRGRSGQHREVTGRVLFEDRGSILRQEHQ